MTPDASLACPESAWRPAPALTPSSHPYRYAVGGAAARAQRRRRASKLTGRRACPPPRFPLPTRTAVGRLRLGGALHGGMGERPGRPHNRGVPLPGSARGSHRLTERKKTLRSTEPLGRRDPHQTSGSPSTRLPQCPRVHARRQGAGGGAKCARPGCPCLIGRRGGRRRSASAATWGGKGADAAAAAIAEAMATGRRRHARTQKAATEDPRRLGRRPPEAGSRGRRAAALTRRPAVKGGEEPKASGSAVGDGQTEPFRGRRWRRPLAG